MEIDAHIAIQLKALRGQRGWTLEQLAQASGVSRAMISRIERQEASATAALLSRLCAALDVPLSTLLGASQPTGMVARKTERPRWKDPATGFIREVVTPPMTGSAVEIVEVELPPLARVNYRLDAPVRYSQHVIALTGGLRVRQGASHDLQSGDTLFMTPEGETSFENMRNQPCRYLVVMERSRTP
ncbi:MAG TPA: XRE family transcriptional regulator [Polaromonas sp.]|uniref:XRE family transcriptional regulator n=1 Tax=Polaromonas sp. TaxID=1869339 RepID=UPI002D6D0638|nr:XRE family transcriptional regulator [Polaromonas sp.]HYW58256.1 XRE family transcriptional regulator [Polaromonas sp.]